VTMSLSKFLLRCASPPRVQSKTQLNNVACLCFIELSKNIDRAVSKLKITLNFPELKMSITHLLPALKTLSRAEKLRVMQFLVQELAMEEEVSLLETGATYHIWSPLNSHKAAQTLATLLEDEQQEDHA
jgi:hypothetical protein